MAHTINTECGVSPTIEKRDLHCRYAASISLSSVSSTSSSSDYTDKWQITYASMRESSLLFEQFVYIKISTAIDTALFISPLIRETCSYSFQSSLSFKSAPSLDNTQMIYTVILPSCNTQSIELCTYYIVIEASNTLIHKAEYNTNLNQSLFSATYELTASLGILLQFQQKYSYLPTSFGDTSTDDDTQSDTTDDINGDISHIMANKLTNSETDRDIVNASCLWYQLYAVKASLTDFPIGIIVQPEFIDTDAGFTVSQYTSTPLTEIRNKEVNTLKGDAESESYNIPSIGDYVSSEDYILIKIAFYLTENAQDVRNIIPNKNVKYIIYSQSNISYIQVSVINSGGWFLLLVLIVLILIAMCRKHCCLRENNEGLSYNDFLENIQLTNPLFINVANANSSNAEDQKSIGVPLEELDKVSEIQVYHKNNYKYKACCICLYDYKKTESIRKLNCNHYFHQKCIDIWFTKNIHCPLCKQFVINATILSKLSANSADRDNTSTSTSITSTTNSISVSETDSSRKSSSSEANETQDLIQTQQEEEHVANIYSLSDNHCIYNAKRDKKTPHNRHVSDDMYITKHSNPNIMARHRNKSWSTSYHPSYSGHSLSSNNITNMNTNTNTTTITSGATAATANSNDISISLSPPTDAIPLAPNINLYFENTFGAQSTSTNPKQE